MRRLLLAVVTISLMACTGSHIGAPCGGGQYAAARAILPDSGINAGDTLLVVLEQHDTQELTELVIWHLWPFASGVTDPEPDPRVRIVRGDGRVLLDSIGSRYNQPVDRYDRLTWHVFTWIRDAELRNAVFAGLRDETLWIELRPAGASELGTRVPLRTERAGLHPAGSCL